MPSSPTERRILQITCVIHFLAHYLELIYPAMTMYVVADLGISIEKAMGAAFLLYLLFGLPAIPVGLLGDRFNPCKVMSIGIMLAGTGSFLAGAIGTAWGLWVFLGMVGLGISTYHPTGMALISKGISERGRALGINGIWGNIGIVSAPLAGGIGGFFLGWRQVLMISGGLAIAAGIAGLMLRLELPRDTEKASTGKLESGKAAPLFVILLLAMVLSGGIYRANSVELPVHFEEQAPSLVSWFAALPLPTGTDQDARTMGAGLLLALAVLIGVFGQRLGGWVADRYDLRKAYLSFFVIALPALVAMAYAKDIWLLLAAAWFMTFFLGMQPIENSLVARLTPPRWRSTSYGMKFTATFGMGASAVWLVTAVRAHLEPSQVFLVLSAVLLLDMAIVTILLLKSRDLDLHQRAD